MKSLDGTGNAWRGMLTNTFRVVRFAQLRDDRRGAALIELALVAPVLIIGIAGVVDVSNAFGRKLAAEQGAQRAIEKIMQTTQEVSVADTLKTEAICQVNGMNANGTCKTSPITAADVTVTYRLECTSSSGTTVTTQIDPSNPTDCATTESQAQYVSVTVRDAYTPMFTAHLFTNSADGKYHVSATAGMRTE